MYSKKTEYGSISLSKNTIGNIVSEAVNEFDGKVILCNPRGKGIDADESRRCTYLAVHENGDSIDLKVYVLIKFGTSISVTTAQLIGAVKSRVEDVTGVRPRIVIIAIRGIIAKNIAKKNIEVEG